MTHDEIRRSMEEIVKFIDGIGPRLSTSTQEELVTINKEVRSTIKRFGFLVTALQFLMDTDPKHKKIYQKDMNAISQSMCCLVMAERSFNFAPKFEHD